VAYHPVRLTLATFFSKFCTRSRYEPSINERRYNLTVGGTEMATGVGERLKKVVVLVSIMVIAIF
jgi:hypothetical protein